MESEIRVVPLEELEAIRAAVLLRKLSPGVGREFGKFSLFPQRLRGISIPYPPTAHISRKVLGSVQRAVLAATR